MKNEYLSEQESDKLSFSEYVRAARLTLAERYLAANPATWVTLSQFGELWRQRLEERSPASDVLHLTPADRALLRGMHIKVEEA